MIDWFNQNSGFSIVLLTAVYVICTLVLCLSAMRANDLARKLHEDIHRPVIVCDFFTQHTCMYFRIKNVGSVAARNVKITAEGPAPQLVGEWKRHHAIANGISFLSPQADLVSFFCAPGHPDKLGVVRFGARYQDANGKTFEDDYVFDLGPWVQEDLGRENNSPIVNELKKVSSCMEKLTANRA